jgi:hypothetical protein
METATAFYVGQLELVAPATSLAVGGEAGLVAQDLLAMATATAFYVVAPESDAVAVWGVLAALGSCAM